MRKIIFENVPEWAIYALEYGVAEDTSLTSEDIKQINDFVEKNFPYGYCMVVDWDSYNSFSTNPLFGLATGTYSVEFYIN